MRNNLVLFIWGLSALGCIESEREWRDEVIYFAMIDRLANGDPSNDDLGQGEWDVESESHFQGGDLLGVSKSLSGIQELGATAVWLTPAVHNQWWNPERTYTGYHGYWASEFEQVDPHFGTWEDWGDLGDLMHNRGLRFIQDVVVNHAGDWVLREGGQSTLRAEPLAHWMHPDSGVYHDRSAIRDYEDPSEILNHELSGLDDFRTEEAFIRRKMRSIYKEWVKRGNVDGFRLDTHRYVERDFWPSFFCGDEEEEGVRTYAESLWGRDFFTFGEVWSHSEADGFSGELEMKQFLRTDTYEGVDAVLNFPLQQTLTRVFAEHASPVELAYRLRIQSEVFNDPSRQLVNFIDNHDMARFRSLTSEASTRQALLTLLSIPGIPVIYQGTEQGDLLPRENLFDRFDVQSEQFLWLKSAIAWRKAHPVISRGKLQSAEVVGSTSLVYWSVALENDTVFILCNPSSERVIAGNVNSNSANRMPDFSWNEGESKLLFSGEEIALADIEPHAWLAWSSWRPATGVASTEAYSEAEAIDGVIRLDGLASVRNGIHRIQLVGLDAQGGALWIDEPHWKHVKNEERMLGWIQDERGDDRGLLGDLMPPTSPGFEHSMDLLSLEVVEQGGLWLLRLRMCEAWSTVWSPRFGFDHVAFEVSIFNAQNTFARWRHSGWSLQSEMGQVHSSGVLENEVLEWVLEAPREKQPWTIRVDAWDADGSGEWRSIKQEAGSYHMGCARSDAKHVMDRIELKL